MSSKSSSRNGENRNRSSEDDDHEERDGHGDRHSNIVGTQGNDTLAGTALDDNIQGGKGSDALAGLAGHDHILGGKGNDLIEGGPGNDRMNGGQGDDTLIGGAGDDYIDGGPHGRDTAVFSGNYADYSISFSAGPIDSEGYKITVIDRRQGSPDGTDTLRRVEVLKFADGEYRDGRFYADSGGNANPVAMADSILADEDLPRVILASELTGNDSDANGDLLTIQSVQAGADTHGTVVLNGDGSISYTPALNYYGPAAFTYSVSDGQGGTSTATVTVSVLPVNDAPVLSGTLATLIEGTQATAYTLTESALLQGYSDVEGDQLSVTGLTSDTGTVTDNGDGTFTITPATGYVGAVTLNYSVSDGNGGDTEAAQRFNLVAQVITANPDVATSTLSAVDNANHVASGNVLINDINLNPGTTLATLPVTYVTAYGQFELNNAGAYTYTLNANSAAALALAGGQLASESFVYTATNGVVSATSTVSLSVIGANDAPVARTDNLLVSEDTALIIPAAQLLANDSDVDGNALTVIGVSGAARVSASLSDGNIVLTPLANFSGSGSFNYTISDGSGGTATGVVNLSIAAVADAPLLSFGDAFGTSGAAIPLSISAALVDADGSESLAIRITGLPPGASLTAGTQTADGSWTLTPAQLGGLALMTTSDLVGAFNLNVSAVSTETSNGSSAVTAPSSALVVTIAASGGGINANPDNEMVLAGNGNPEVVGNVLANDTDSTPGAVLSVAPYSITTQYGQFALSAEGAYTYTLMSDSAEVQALAAQQAVTDVFSYEVSNGIETASATLTVTIVGANDAPLVNADAAATDDSSAVTLDVLLNDTDPDAGDAYAIVLAPGSLSAGGAGLSIVDEKIVYDPGSAFLYLAAGEVVDDTFTYVVRDGLGAESAGTVTVTVTGLNQAPVASDQMVTAYSGITYGDMMPGTDPDLGDVLTFTLAPGGDPQHGVLQFESDGSYDYTPDWDYTGEDAFSFTVSDDNGMFSVATVTIDVLASVAPFFTEYNDSKIFDDVVIGDYLPDTQYNALAGHDIVSLPSNQTEADEAGYDPSNVFYAGEGDDVVTTGDLDDLVDMEAGDDFIYGSNGGDTLNGGAGNNTVSYEFLGAGVDANASTGSGNGATFKADNVDTLINIQNIIGTAFDDIVVGDAQVNQLAGLAGNDILVGGDGGDALLGGTGADQFVYSGLSEGLDLIGDFNAGEGDVLDIRDLLSGYDPGSSSIAQFVYLSESAEGTTLSVDEFGSGDSGNAVDMVTLIGVYNPMGTLLDDLLSQGNLIVS